MDGLELLVIDVEAPGSFEGSAELTDAEREVARLAVDGCSDAQIASRRGTSRSTVANQLGRIYKKLGITSRAELVALSSRRGATPEP